MPGSQTFRDRHSRRNFFSCFAVFATAVFVAPLSASSSAADGRSIKERLIGTWAFVSSVNTRRDGTPYDRWGTAPKGTLMFDASGRYSQIIMRSETKIFGPKTIFSFGTFTVDEANDTIVTHIEGASITRMMGTRQRRDIKVLTADELRYVNRDGMSGAVIEATWRRVHPNGPHSASLAPAR